MLTMEFLIVVLLVHSLTAFALALAPQLLIAIAQLRYGVSAACAKSVFECLDDDFVTVRRHSARSACMRH